MVSEPPIPLLPCPFCGEAPYDVVGGTPQGYGVVCPHCDYRGPEDMSPERAAERWNTRTRPMPDSSLIEGLDDLLGEAYQIAGRIILADPEEIKAALGQGTRLLNILSFDAPNIIERMHAHPILDSFSEIIGLLEPIAEQDWHGKWRINKAIAILRQHKARPAWAESGKRYDLEFTTIHHEAKDGARCPSVFSKEDASHSNIEAAQALESSPDSIESWQQVLNDAVAYRKLKGSESSLETNIAMTMMQATEILNNFKTEGNRTKYDELEACYAMLFRQMRPLIEENKRLKASEIPYNKCPDCGADMIEVCSGLENIARGDAASSCRHADYCEKPTKSVSGSVSLMDCAMALQGNERIKLGSDLQAIAKVVLDVAGVFYVV